MENRDAKKLITDFQHNLPISSMALCYLLEKGSEQVKSTTEEEFSAATQQNMEECQKRGHTYLLTLPVALSIFRYAKKLADVDAMDLVTLIGNGVFSDSYLNKVYGTDTVANFQICPCCGKRMFLREEENHGTLICAACGQEI